MLKTLARKHDSSVTKIAARHRPKSTHRTGRAHASKPSWSGKARKPLVARFGGIPLKRQKTRSSDRVPPATTPPQRADLSAPRTVRVLRGSGTCKSTISASSPNSTSGQPQPAWTQIMAKRRRKTLVVCALPRPHPHRATTTTHGIVTGEPGAGNRTPGSEGGRAEKDPTRVTSPRGLPGRCGCAGPWSHTRPRRWPGSPR